MFIYSILKKWLKVEIVLPIGIFSHSFFFSALKERMVRNRMVSIHNDAGDKLVEPRYVQKSLPPTIASWALQPLILLSEVTYLKGMASRIYYSRRHGMSFIMTSIELTLDFFTLLLCCLKSIAELLFGAQGY